ncbi:MAG: ABC transporter substrate-binding protein [Cryobacterium sp.]|uniref:ABC transporter substrate-binding protein n=1 Tax=unclassified Cryobacterium TaxID=2649013 RepID=UPI0018C8FE9E|nr:MULTISPECIES: ABC transporter substrate-binding protein [unclassified Cryobacterium]MCY7403253.1 ABC transporter substrate-binding protein [Cryobacterium sp.]MEC5154499.1 alpha-glucoside transport system substrate-binding protein [Cryobacterium sp. CAN_C3]
MRTSLHRRITAPIAMAAIAGLALAGCSGGPGSTTNDAGAEGDGVVTVYSTIADFEAEQLEKSWADWEKENNIDIQYESSKEFESQISIRAQGGNPPDIGIFPQPGLLADLASRKFIKPAPAAVEANVDEYWSEDWKAYGTVDDVFYGAPFKANLKGFIWFSPAKFKEWGVEVPTTWDELLTVTKTIQEKTGAAPWCAGFGSGDATGWPGTDWVEDLVLRQAGPDVYDQWVANEVPFTDPAIAEAFDSVGEILLNPDYVNAGFGDVKSINSVPFGDVAAPIVAGTCALTHQASFFDGFLGDAGGKVGPDSDIWAFMTPSIEAGGQAVVGGGEIVGAFADDADTQAVQEYLSTPEWANSLVSIGGGISANSGVDPDLVDSPILAESIRILQDPDTTFRFDASDLMPGAVGSGTFFKGIVSWINGTPTSEVLTSIEAGWPSS